MLLLIVKKSQNELVRRNSIAQKIVLESQKVKSSWKRVDTIWHRIKRFQLGDIELRLLGSKSWLSKGV